MPSLEEPPMVSSGVNAVPMCAPRMMGMAEPKVTRPVLDSACKIPTEAEEDWMITVTTTPTSTPRMGLVMLTNSSWNAALSRRGGHAGVHQAHARKQNAEAQHDLTDVLFSWRCG